MWILPWQPEDTFLTLPFCYLQQKQILLLVSFFFYIFVVKCSVFLKYFRLRVLIAKTKANEIQKRKFSSVTEIQVYPITRLQNGIHWLCCLFCFVFFYTKTFTTNPRKNSKRAFAGKFQLQQDISWPKLMNSKCVDY